MADKTAGASWRETQDARREQFADFLTAEAGRAVADVRQKLVEEAWSGQKQTPRVGDHKEPFETYLNAENKVDIHGNSLDGKAQPVDGPYQSEGLPNDNTAGLGQDRPADRPGDFFSYMDRTCGTEAGEGRGQDRSHQRDQSMEP